MMPEANRESRSLSDDQSAQNRSLETERRAAPPLSCEGQSAGVEANKISPVDTVGAEDVAVHCPYCLKPVPRPALMDDPPWRCPACEAIIAVPSYIVPLLRKALTAATGKSARDGAVAPGTHAPMGTDAAATFSPQQSDATEGIAESDLAKREERIAHDAAALRKKGKAVRDREALLRSRERSCARLEGRYKRLKLEVAKANASLAKSRRTGRRLRRELNDANDRAESLVRQVKLLCRRSSGNGGIDSTGWHMTTPLTERGYRVGMTGLFKEDRRGVLRQVIEHRLVFPEGLAAYEKAAWGAPRSRKRVRRVIDQINHNIDFHGGRLGYDSTAVNEWRADLLWLKQRYLR